MREKIIEIIKNESPKNQQQIVDSLAAKNITATQANIQYHLDRIGAYKENGFYKVPSKKLDFKSLIKDLILNKKENKEKGEIYLFCFEGTSSLIMNVICQNYHLGDLCFKYSYSSSNEEILTIETKFSQINFEKCLEIINEIIGE